MRVKLLTPHTHCGRQYPAGAYIALRPDQAQWLAALGVAEAAPAAEPPASPAKAEKKE